MGPKITHSIFHKTKFKSLSEFLRKAFYPEDIKCISCGRELSEYTRYGLCPNCKLEYNETFCEICGISVPAQNRFCDKCKIITHEFDLARSSVLYNGDAAKLVQRLKYHDARYLARYMAEFMADVYYTQNIEADVVTAVPMYKSHLRSRGYNQSELLATELGKRIKLPYERLLVKTVKTKSMVGLGREARLKLIKGSIELCPEANLKGKKVLIADDVITTGATSDECARVLKLGGAAKVFVITFSSSVSKPTLT